MSVTQKPRSDGSAPCWSSCLLHRVAPMSVTEPCCFAHAPTSCVLFCFLCVECLSFLLQVLLFLRSLVNTTSSCKIGCESHHLSEAISDPLHLAFPRIHFRTLMLHAHLPTRRRAVSVVSVNLNAPTLLTQNAVHLLNE